MRLPSYLHPWRRRLGVSAVLGLAAGAGLSVALVGADRTSGTVALAQAVLGAAVVGALFYAFCRSVIPFLRKAWDDPQFAREPHPYPEVFAVGATFFLAAATVCVLTWAGLGRGFIV